MEDTPSHKDLVLVETERGSVVPAIYFDNQDFNGFFAYSTFYTWFTDVACYNKVKLKEKHRINNVVKWQLIPEKL